jgi:dTMP kinase
VLDVPAKLGLERATLRRGAKAADRFETETLEYHEKLRQAYLELAEREPDRCVVIEGSAEPAIVADAIWAVVNHRLEPAEAPVVTEDVLP